MEYMREKSALAALKTLDLRRDALYQCDTAVDRGIHIGGAYSALPPMVALFYGGFIDLDIEHPTSEEQDVFILSKGHAVAALAAVYADLGYFDRKHLAGSRSWDALVKGHPGPVIPGVPVSTGPLGHGISVSAGYALRRKELGWGDVYCLCGDGELQEGSNWEGALFAGDKNLSNLCVIVDKNNGQSDDTTKLLVGLEQVDRQFEAFGFRVLQANAEEPASLLAALEAFKEAPRGAQPTAIICHSEKGIGGHGLVMNKHKANLDEAAVGCECAFLDSARQRQITHLRHFDADTVEALAVGFGYDCRRDGGGRITDLIRRNTAAKPKKAPVRDKKLRYDAARLPRLEDGGEYGAFEIIAKTMAVFGTDERVYSIDADLSNASGLYDGLRATNRLHAINAGIAELNMMCMAEALAADGCNVFTSTFAPFFNWQAMRRIAVTWQEREEVIAEKEGWLSEGHNLDITFLATAANLDTAVNGATHMANDDSCFFAQMAHLKIIDISCPRQLLAVLRWIAEGNRGLVYVRLMRNPSRPLYAADFRFEYGKGWYLRKADAPRAAIVTSGHGVLEALQAEELLAQSGIAVDVVDMASFDEALSVQLAQSGLPLLFAEQNNGALFGRFSAHLLRQGVSVDASRVHQLSALSKEGHPQFIQSGTYEEITDALGLSAGALAAYIKAIV